MGALQMIRTYIEYHVDMTRRVWGSIDQISDEQFVADEAYSRGSIRNLMVHLAHTDLRWLTGLKNLPDPAESMKAYEAFTNRASGHEYSEAVATQLSDYVSGLDDSRLGENPAYIPGPRWEVLLHLVNHGTDHRSTVMQKLHTYGAPTFDQDFILWLAEKA
jgi:uncharacterized damage-inducible protein DinB